MNKSLKAVLAAMGAALFVIGVVIMAILLSVAVGYLVGMLLMVTPFISDWLVAGLPVTKSQIPGIMAWVGAISTILGSTRKAVKSDE